MDIGFVDGAYIGRTRASESDRCVNLFVEQSSHAGKSQSILLGTPGCDLFTAVAGASRGSHVMGDKLYKVAAGKLWEINAAGVSTEIGTLNTTSGHVSMADNGTQLMIVDGLNGYIYNTSTLVFGQIVAAGFPANPVQCVFISGYFVTILEGSGQYYWSSPYDGTAWSALDFATAEAMPDNIVSIKAMSGRLWLFGENSIEILVVTTSGAYLFQSMGGAFFEVGCAARWSTAVIDNSIMWLASSQRGERVIMRASGFDGTRVSTHAIENTIAGYTTPSDAFGIAYVDGGHSFYCLSFTADNATWCFDVATGLWHKRESDGGRWLANSYAFFNGRHYVDDYRNGNVYRLSNTTYTENGSTIKRVRACRHISNDGEYIFANALEIDFEGGVGLATGQGSDPQVMLRISRDGGFTWGKELWRSIGKAGEYKKRVRWNRLGASRDFVFEVTITDPVNVVIVGATLA